MLATYVATSVFCDFRDLSVDEEWSLDELSDDGGKLNLSTNLFHRMLSNETCITLYTYIVLSNLRKIQGQGIGYFQISIITRKKLMDLRNIFKINILPLIHIIIFKL